MNLIKAFYDPRRMVKQKDVLGELPGARAAYADVARIALPSVAEMVLMSLIGSVDTMMVGQLGETALSAVALPGQPRMIMLCMFFALNVGVTAIIARRKGEERRDAANLTLRNALMLVLLLSLVVMGLAVSLAEPLMRLSGGNENTTADAIVLRDAVDYFTIMAWALPVNAVAMCINASQRGIGNTKLTMYVNIVSNVVNVIFNYLLIGGNFGFPRLEVRGAAIASVIGMVTGSSLALFTVLRGKRHEGYLHVSFRESWRFDKSTMRSIVKVGGNAMIEQLSMRFGFFVYSRVMYGMGVTMYAAHQICMQFLNITFTFGDGIGVAGTSLVGQCLGRMRSDLAQMYGLICQRLALTVSVVIGVLIVLLRNQLPALFIGQDTQNAALVMGYAAETLLVVALIQPFQTSSVVLSGGLRGAGDNLYVAVCMGVCVSVIRPLMALLSVNVLHLSLAMVWLLSISEIVCRMVLFYARFAGGKWKTMKV